jgi:hypothetical protein
MAVGLAASLYRGLKEIGAYAFACFNPFYIRLMFGRAAIGQGIVSAKKKV